MLPDEPLSVKGRKAMKTALVCGAGGFIASHLVKELKKQGYWVRGVDIKTPEWSESAADEFMVADLRKERHCETALNLPSSISPSKTFDEVYQLAADMGGMGFIHSAECEIMHNSILINVYMSHLAAKMGVKRYFFSSSVCVYRDMTIGEEEIDENAAYPAQPDNEYGWEKLYSERMALAYGRKYGMEVRIARFQNCYGEEGTYDGGREKAPAAISRKVAKAEDEGSIDVWGDGSAIRSYIHVSDLVRAIYLLTQSDIKSPTNIGHPEYVSVDDLAQRIINISGKKLSIKHVDGPVGVQSRNFSNNQIYSLGWECELSLNEGLQRTYNWVNQQIHKT